MKCIKRNFAGALFGLACALVLASTSQAQDDPETFIDWVDGPAVAKLGDVGEITIPIGYRFADGVGARKFLELTQNIPSGNELGVLVPDSATWFTIFAFSPIGYVKDADKDQLDAEVLLASMKKGNDDANELRRKNGWGTMEIEGWARKPFYDPATNNLTWAITGHDEQQRRSVNHSVRILGRRGAMKAGLVLAPEGFESAVLELDTLLTGFHYVEGERYSEWRDGDYVAKYGLTALVAGTAGAVAMKTGLLAKFWKVIVLGVLGIVAAARKLLSRIFGGAKGPKQ